MRLATDPTGSVTFVDAAWERWTGQPVHAALGAGWLERIHPSDRAIVVDRLREASRDKEQLILTYRLFLRQGDFRWVTTSIGPKSTSGTGEFAGLSGTIDFDAKLPETGEPHPGVPVIPDDVESAAATPIEDLADRVMAARHLAAAVREPVITAILDMALVEIGFRLANPH